MHTCAWRCPECKRALGVRALNMYAYALVEPQAADDEGGAGEREQEGDAVGDLCCYIVWVCVCVWMGGGVAYGGAHINVIYKHTPFICTHMSCLQRTCPKSPMKEANSSVTRKGSLGNWAVNCRLASTCMVNECVAMGDVLVPVFLVGECAGRQVEQDIDGWIDL